MGPVLFFWMQGVCRASVKNSNFGMFCPQFLQYCHCIVTLPHCNIGHLTGFPSFFLLFELSVYLDKYLSLVTMGGSGYYFIIFITHIYVILILILLIEHEYNFLLQHQCVSAHYGQALDWLDFQRQLCQSQSLLDTVIVIPAELPGESLSWLKVKEPQSSCQPRYLTAEIFKILFLLFLFALKEM